MARSPLILDRYRVIDQAGSGGYGTVVHAFDTHLKRDVAIKCIELSEDELAAARLEALEARMAADLEEVEAGASGAEAGTAGRNAGPGAASGIGAGMGATAGYPAGSSSADAFPADPDFLAARDERRRRRPATAAASRRVASEEVPPWEEWDDAAAEEDVEGEGEWEESLIPWNASTTDFVGRRRGPARLTGRVSRKTRHAPEVLYEPQTVVEEAPDATGATPDAESVDVRHLRGVRASRVIAEEPEPDAEDELDLFEHIPGLEEARSVAKLSDTNIVTVYDCAVEGSSAYVIMEYVEGKTLAQIIDEVDDDITLDVVAAVFSAVSHALEVAHGEHTLHLDIKPENVIVNGKGQAKVADFGLAALMDATGSGTTGGGTIGYMPLEQMRQEPLDVRTDEWALASLTYEMLTGSNPFFADDLDAAEEAIEEAELVLPSLCWDELDAEADEVMFAALDPDMDERYEDVAAFSAALSPYLGNAKKGKRVLADIVNGKMEEPAAEEPERAWEPLPPLVDRLGLRGAAIAGRIVAAAAVALLAAAGMANLHLTPGSAMGLATDAPIAYGVVIAVCALVAAIRPSIGVLFGYGAFVVGLAGAGAWVPAVLLTAATGAWWYFVGRRGTAQAVSALMQPLLGSVGFAAAGAAIGHYGGLRLRECPHHGRLRLGRHHELGRGHAPRLLEQPGGRVPGGGVAAGHLGRGRKLDRRCGPLQPLVRARHPCLRHRRFGGGCRGAHVRCVRGGPSRFLRRLVATRSGGTARSAGARRSRHPGRDHEHPRSRPLGRRRMVCGRREVGHFPAGHSILTAPMTNPLAAARAA